MKNKIGNKHIKSDYFYLMAIFCCVALTLSIKSHYDRVEMEKKFNELYETSQTNIATMNLLKDELELCDEDFKQVWEENKLFGSMLGAIEGEPGGSEILQTLFDEFHEEETK